MSVYKYQLGKTLPVYFLLGCGAAFFVVLWAVIIPPSETRTFPFFIWFVLYTPPAMFLVGALLGFLTYRPIGIGDEGIATFMFGKQRQFLAWSAVTKVERVRFYHSPTMRFRHEFWVHADRSRIRFDDYIGHLDRLLERLNGYITEHHIPAFEVDRGRETRRAPVATLADIAQGKSLDGVRTPTAKF